MGQDLLIERPMTRTEFTAAQQRVRDMGREIDGDVGTISDMGVTIRYYYDGDVLRVRLVSKPWVIRKSTVQSKVQEMFAEFERKA